MMQRRVTVGLKYDVYSKLKEKGRFGETFSDLVSRILDELRAKNGGGKPLC